MDMWYLWHSHRCVSRLSLSYAGLELTLRLLLLVVPIWSSVNNSKCPQNSGHLWTTRSVSELTSRLLLWVVPICSSLNNSKSPKLGLNFLHGLLSLVQTGSIKPTTIGAPAQRGRGKSKWLLEIWLYFAKTGYGSIKKLFTLWLNRDFKDRNPYGYKMQWSWNGWLSQSFG